MRKGSKNNILLLLVGEARQTDMCALLVAFLVATTKATQEELSLTRNLRVWCIRWWGSHGRSERQLRLQDQK